MRESNVRLPTGQAPECSDYRFALHEKEVGQRTVCSANDPRQDMIWYVRWRGEYLKPACDERAYSGLVSVHRRHAAAWEGLSNVTRLSVSESTVPGLTMPGLIVGCAGWSIPTASTARVPDGESHLERYACRFNGVEINSSFYRAHLPSTYRRWAAAVPDGFSFAVKMPRAISHEGRITDVEPALRVFLGQVHELGSKLGCLLLQLPPGLTYTRSVALDFFDLLATLHGGPVACEPRHASWFEHDVARDLRERGVSRVAADPARHPRAGVPAGNQNLQYYRLHGSPRVYYDTYSAKDLRSIERRLRRPSETTVQRWCIFDNTASGHAMANGLDLVERLEDTMTSD